MNDHADDNELFKKLIPKPRIAWPTVMLLIAAFTIFGMSTFTYLAGILPLLWAMPINTIASYMAFSIAHAFFQVFRFVHMKHHRFTNDSEKDPDVYCGTGPKWLLPFKWLTLDFVYFKTYLSPDVFQKRPKRERKEFYFAILFMVIVITAITLAGWLNYYLLLFFIPTRIAKYIIVIAFDFLPHYPHEAYAKDEPYRCTSNRVGMEWLMTPLFIYQNYHLVHHLYPAVPFYRYIKIWNARKHYHEAQNPAITDTFSLKPR